MKYEKPQREYDQKICKLKESELKAKDEDYFYGHDSFVDIGTSEEYKVIKKNSLANSKNQDESPFSRFESIDSGYIQKQNDDEDSKDEERFSSPEKLNLSVSVIDNNSSWFKDIPISNQEEGLVNNIKGAFLGGITNLNYFLNDTGVMGIVGVKKLVFDDSKDLVWLFSSKYLSFQKDKFMGDFADIIWLTYRQNFVGLLNRKEFLDIKNFDKKIDKDRQIHTSDTGWGWMIRVAQMILGRVLYLLLSETKVQINFDYFSEEGVKNKHDSSSRKLSGDITDCKREIIKLFLDNLKDKSAPFSIQNFVEHGYSRYKKKPGEWYGANSASVILQDLNATFHPLKRLEVISFNNMGIKETICREKAQVNWQCDNPFDEPLAKNFEIIDREDLDLSKKLLDVPEPKMEKHKSCECNQFDNTLFVSTNRYNEKLEDSDFEEDHFDFDVDLRRSNSKGMAKLNTNWKKKLFIIICVRLGLNKVPEEQYSSIKEVLKFPQSVGIMGGKKNKALYFVGSEGDSLIFLDPHYVHDAVSKDYKNFSLETYSCDTPKKLSMGYLDPCLGFGFLIRDEDDFVDFKRRIGALKKSDQYFDYISVI